MPSSNSTLRRPILPCIILSLCLAFADSLASQPSRHQTNRQHTDVSSRRAFLSTSAAATAFFTSISRPQSADARYILNDDGEYEEIEEEAWQAAWGKRLEKAKTMSTEDIFLAAQGAGNLDLKEGVEESEASKKRRAMAGCRNDGMRAKGGMDSRKECTARVIGGDYQFMIDALK